MRIDGKKMVGGVTGGKGARAGGPGFSALLDTREAEPAKAVSPASLLAGILPLAAADDEEARRRRAVRHGMDLLDALEALRRAIILGTLDADQLADLSARLDLTPQPADPKLAALLDEISVRVSVELAKFGR